MICRNDFDDYHRHKGTNFLSNQANVKQKQLKQLTQHEKMVVISSS